MSDKGYLQTLLDNQMLDESELDTLSEHRKEVESFLREEFGSTPTIKYGGSKAKGTMIQESYDLDIICYFPDTENRTLKEIYDDAKNVLGKNYIVDPKTSAIRIIDLKHENGDYHIDVVPGKFIDKDKSDAFLHISTAEGERMQTNIDTHIKTIKDSQCQEVIKLIKLWKVRNGINFRTFVLELAVIRAMDDFSDKDDLEKSLREALLFLKDNIQNVKLVDPANSNNIVSEILSEADKAIISMSAENSLEIIESVDEPGESEWKRVFREVTASTNIYTPISEPKVNKPWLNG
jgi:hypothetical protein